MTTSNTTFVFPPPPPPPPNVTASTGQPGFIAYTKPSFNSSGDGGGRTNRGVFRGRGPGRGRGDRTRESRGGFSNPERGGSRGYHMNGQYYGGHDGQSVYSTPV